MLYEACVALALSSLDESWVLARRKRLAPVFRNNPEYLVLKPHVTLLWFASLSPEQLLALRQLTREFTRQHNLASRLRLLPRHQKLARSLTFQFVKSAAAALRELQGWWLSQSRAHRLPITDLHVAHRYIPHVTLIPHAFGRGNASTHVVLHRPLPCSYLTARGALLFWKRKAHTVRPKWLTFDFCNESR
jgi:hypothetical protein